jgi:hypothetical protein
MLLGAGKSLARGRSDMFGAVQIGSHGSAMLGYPLETTSSSS